MNMRTLSNSEISKNFSFINLVTTNKVKKLLQSLSATMTERINSIQHKLVKLVDIPFFNLLTEAIKFCMQRSIFPDSAKVVSIDPLDKRKQKKEISSFRPVGILNTASKIYELAIKKQMVTGTKKYLYQLIEKSPVIIKLIKNWRENLA